MGRIHLTKVVHETLLCVRDYMNNPKMLMECLDEVSNEEWRTYVGFAISMLMMQHNVPRNIPMVSFMPRRDTVEICIYDCNDERCLAFMEDLAMLLEQITFNTAAMKITISKDRICLSNIRWNEVRQKLM